MRWWPKQRVSTEDMEQADQRLAEAKKLAAKSRQVSAKLSREIAINGWTEKFEAAMGRRA
jgi:hypothetical protein